MSSVDGVDGVDDSGGGVDGVDGNLAGAGEMGWKDEVDVTLL